MVKRREPQATAALVKHQPTPDEIEAFAAGADGGIAIPEKKAVLDPDANRDYKAIRVPFNEYEYSILETAARKTGRTKLNYIRWAILKMAEDAQ